MELKRTEPPLGIVYNDFTKRIEYWEEVDLMLGLGYGQIVRVIQKVEDYPESHHLE